MKLLTLVLYLFLCSTYTYSQQKNESLHKRVSGFYSVEENINISKEEKIDLIKSYIRPGNDNDRMALFFYESWLKFRASSGKVKTKIVNIEISPEGSNAIVTTQDKVIEKTGEKIVFLSKAEWVKIDNTWYRETNKSELYKNGQRIR